MPPFLDVDAEAEREAEDAVEAESFAAVPPFLVADQDARAAGADADPGEVEEPEADEAFEEDEATDLPEAADVPDARVVDVPEVAIAAAALHEAAPEVAPEASPEVTPYVTPTPEAAPDTVPPDEELWPQPDWPESDTSTRVLPTDWTPPPPPPPASETEAAAELEPVAGDLRTSLGERVEPDVEPEVDTTTAEQAVPWLIGLILLLAGMVIVLLALIFAGDQSLAGPSPSPASSAAGAVSTATARPTASAAGSAGASATAAPTPTPPSVPAYGPLEMIYQGRAAALAPIYLLLHDFTTEDEASVLAQDPTIDVRRFTWAPDGTVGAGLLADILVSIEVGESKRNLGEGLMTITFGPDASTVYAVRVTADGGNDIATVLAVDFESGDSTEVTSVTYARPTIGAEAALPEAQFSDDGGTVRLHWMSDGSLRLWVLGASTWEIDPESGDTTDLDGNELPVLVDGGGTHRISVTANEDGSATVLKYLDESDDEISRTTAPGLVSHLRWSPGNDRVVFTVGRSASGGGVLQDLFLWDLDTVAEPMQITNTGAAFGPEWRGAAPRWEAG